MQISLPKTNRNSYFAFVFIALIFVCVKIHHIATIDNVWERNPTISWDVYGYYLHLPATFIHNDPGMVHHEWFDTINATYRAGDPVYQVHDGINGRLVNVYTTGQAVLWLPWFTLGHLSANVFDYPQDGMSAPYQLFVIIGSVIYTLLGFWWLRKLLLHFVSDNAAAYTMICIALGTNLFNYATAENVFPHISIFSFGIGVLLLTISWHQNPQFKTAFALGCTIGLITIIRPSEFIWILVPLLWNLGSSQMIKDKFSKIKKHWLHLLVFSLGLMGVGCIQLFYWQYTSGHWITNSHIEFFDFFEPFLQQVLFSYKKGWLVYTPIMIFSILGLIMLLRWNRNLFIPFIFFFLINLWVISSWECWWYAGSFSQRPFVQSYGLMAIPLGLLIEKSSALNWWKNSLTIILSLLICLNLFQAYQYRTGVLDSMHMSKKYYWAIFGKSSVPEPIKKLKEIDRDSPYEMDDANDYEVNVLFADDFENRNSDGYYLVCDSFAFAGKRSIRLDSTHEFGYGFIGRFDSLCKGDHIRIKAECDVFIPAETFDDRLSFVNLVHGKFRDYGYAMFPVQNHGAKPGEWTHVTVWMVSPEILHGRDKINIQLWNNGRSTCWVDNLNVTLYCKKEN
jgi:hypothetical protein